MIKCNMNNKKSGKRAKILLLLLGTAFCTLSLSGCGNSENNTAGSEGEVLSFDVRESIIKNYESNEESDDEMNDNLSEDNNASDENIIESGMYKVGKDIEPGEYIIFADTADCSGYYCLSNDSNGDDIIYNDNFDYNSILTIRDNEYLELSHSYAILFDDVEKLDTDGHDGMFKVGTHISPGEYELTLLQNNDSGYFCIYTDSRCDNIESNDNFERNAYVTVKDGQYLKLNKCQISELIQEDNTALNKEPVQEENAALNEKLGCPFTAKEFENIYTSKLDTSKYDLSSEYISDYEFWQLNVVNEDAEIAIEEIEKEDTVSDTIHFYINYGLEEGIFREIVGAFIETLYPDMIQEEHDSLLDEFTGNYMNEDGSYSGIRGEGEINIIMEPWKSLSSNGVRISALKK